MKKVIIIIILLLVIGFNSKAQSYQDAFDIVYMNSDWSLSEIPMDTSLLTASVGENIRYVMSSYIIMYKATSDIKYLQQLVENIAMLMSLRDDNTGRRDHLGVIRPVWVTCIDSEEIFKPYTGRKNNNYSGIYKDGLLTYPMADFAQLVLYNEDLYKILSEHNNYGYYSEMSFYDIAISLVDEIKKTIESHEDQWDNYLGYYRFRDEDILQDYAKNNVLPFNQQYVLGLTLLYMDKALIALNRDNTEYRNKINKLISNFKNEINFIPFSFYNVYWNYWPRISVSGNDALPKNHVEDVGHGVPEINFACEYYNYLPNSSLYNKLLLISNTFENIVYRNSNEISEYVNGIGTCSTPANIGVYLPLCQFNEDLNQIVLDIFLSDSSHGLPYKRIFPDLNTKAWWGHDLKTVAYLEYYKNFLTSFGYNHDPGTNSDFVGIASGDFNGDGVDEFVAVRNYDGNFLMYQHGPYINGKIPALNSFTGYGSASNWSDVSAGDFNGDGIDEFIASRNYDGKISILELINNQISIKTTAIPLFKPNWTGIATGNFSGNNNDEFVILNNNILNNKVNGFYIFGFDNNTNRIYEISKSTGWGISSDWACATSGNFTGDDYDEFIVIRNNNNNGKSEIKMYKMYNNVIQGIYSYEGQTNDEWIDVAAGNFGEQYDEFVAYNKKDGNLYFFVFRDSKIQLKKVEYFPEKHDISAITSGDINDENDNDELITVRNFDGDIFVYNVNSRKDVLKLNYTTFNNKNNNNIWFDGNIENIENLNVIENNIILYPNPSDNGIFYMELPDRGLKEINIFNEEGNLIFRTQTYGSNIKIKIPKITGIFFIRIKFKNNFIVKKIIIN